MGENNDQFASSDPRWPVDQTKDSDWEEITETETQAVEWFDALNNALSRLGRKVEKTSKILEIGTGRGVLLELLHRRGYDVVGFDARPRHSGALPVAAGRAEQLPFADATFDVVLSRGAFSSLYQQDFDLMLREAHRVLKRGGFFCGLPKQLLLESPEVKMTAVGLTDMPFSTPQYNIYKKTA